MSNLQTRVIGVGWRWIAAGAAFAVLSPDSISSAQTVVMEAEVRGSAPPAESASVKTQLVALGCLDERALANRIAATHSIPGGLLDLAAADQLRAQVEHGFRAFQQGQFNESIEELDRALASFAAAPATVAEKQELRDVILRAHVGLALAHNRLGQTKEITRVVGDLIRLFPDREVSRRDYGPEALQLVKQVRTELDAGPRGGLHVEVTDDPGAVVFVNERYVSVGKADLASLYPGAYRVYVSGRRRGRVHLVDVEGGKTTSLRVNLELEATLHTSDERAALVFDSQSDLEDGSIRVASALREWLAADRVVVLRRGRVEQRRLLIGPLVDSDARDPLREGAIGLASGSSTSASALAAFLFNGTGSTEVLTGSALRPLPSAKDEPSQPQRYLPREPWYRDKLGWALLASGLVTAGVGGGFLWNAATTETDADRTVDEFERRSQLETADDRRLTGFILLPTGGVIAILGAIKLAVPGRRRVRSEGLALVGGPGFVGLAGAF